MASDPWIASLNHGKIESIQDFRKGAGVSTPDRYRRLIGEVAQELGFVSQEAIEEALAVQKQRRSEGRKVPLLGHILVELNHLTPEQLQQLIEVIYPVSEEQAGDSEAPSKTSEEN